MPEDEPNQPSESIAHGDEVIHSRLRPEFRNAGLADPE
jgi:hypothetical protein